MIDSQLRQDIIDELEFDPSLDAAHIGVAVDKNVVSLTGHVSSYAEKMAAITATRRVRGVHAIAENIEVSYPSQHKTADDQIAKRACDILNWDVLVRRERSTSWFRTAGSHSAGTSTGIIKKRPQRRTCASCPGCAA